MNRAQKILAKWDNRPKEVPRKEVEVVLDEFFPNEWDWEGGSHIVIRSQVLKKYKHYQPYGEVSVPVKSGRKIKGFYIKAILQAIRVLEYDRENPDE